MEVQRENTMNEREGPSTQIAPHLPESYAYFTVAERYVPSQRESVFSLALDETRIFGQAVTNI